MVRAAAGVIDRFRVRVRSPLVPIGTLSGGNVQKVLLGRELAFDPSVLVCKEPTQGLDLRTTEEVRATLRRRAASGGATLLVSSDLDELLELSDRIGVLFRGELVGPFPRDEIGRAAIGRMMVSGDSAEVRR
jgi:simple sugar transport system ATP-binding protein